MFGSSIGAGEILLILAAILLLFGAQRLPSIARSLGRALEEFRRSARDLTEKVLEDGAPPHPPDAGPPPVAPHRPAPPDNPTPG